MSLKLPAEIGGGTGAEILCHEEIVRTVTTPSVYTQAGLAARIFEYRLVRTQCQESLLGSYAKVFPPQ